jgi:hypothetical protein
LVLDERVSGLKRQASEKKTKEIQPQRSSEVESRVKKPEIETEIGKKSEGSIAKRLFRRKQV